MGWMGRVLMVRPRRNQSLKEFVLFFPLTVPVFGIQQAEAAWCVGRVFLNKIDGTGEGAIFVLNSLLSPSYRSPTFLF